MPHVITLDALRFGLQRHLSASALAPLNYVDLKVFLDDFTRGLTVELNATVYGHKLEQTNVVSDTKTVTWGTFPTPWQHWKANRLKSSLRLTGWLRWLVVKRPPQVEVHHENVRLQVKWDAYNLFPDMDFYPPKLGTPVRFLQPGEPQWLTP